MIEFFIQEYGLSARDFWHKQTPEAREARMIYTYLCYALDKNATRTSVAHKIGAHYNTVKYRIETCRNRIKENWKFEYKVERLKNECITRKLQ